MFWLSGLLGSDLLYLGPDPSEFSFTGGSHVDCLSRAESGEGDLDAAGLLKFLAGRSTKNMVDE